MVVAHQLLVSAQGPLVFGIWVWGLGVWGLGLTIKKQYNKIKEKGLALLIANLVVLCRQLVKIRLDSTSPILNV